MFKPTLSYGFLLSCALVVPCFLAGCLNAQTVIGGDTIDQSAILDIQDTAKGVLLPRLTTAQRNAMVRPAPGLLILNTTRQCLEVNTGSANIPNWKCLTSGVSHISDADTLYWNQKLGASDTLSLSDRIDKTGLPASGNSAGNMLFWDGTAWVRVAPGLPGQALVLSQEGFPIWTGAALATVTTNIPSTVTPTSATVGGQISADGGANVSARGIVWGPTVNPTLSSGVLVLGNGTGSFSGTLSGLSPSTTYYIRAYATNSAGTAYGNQQIVVTQMPTVPSLSTREVIRVANTTATSGGVISNDGGSAIAAKGVVWATTANPTLSDNKTTDGTGMETYSSVLTGLAIGTTYYLRAYATNAVGTGYGDERSFVFTSELSDCGAYVAPGNWKSFMCHNLGVANASADPFTPSWEINGGYWQWGRKEMAAAGPTGPEASQANDGAIIGWNTNSAPADSWLNDNKTTNDPCPTGYRVPTLTQWLGLIANNSKEIIGSSWTPGATNYSTGIKFEDSLFLPAASGRETVAGELFLRGNRGYYYSSTYFSNCCGWTLFFDNNNLNTQGFTATNGFSIRCIAE